MLLGSSSFPKWQARTREGLARDKRASGLVEATVWNAEPKLPARIDAARFTRALKRLCTKLDDAQAERYAAAFLREAARYGEDPFLIAGLAHRLTQCDPDYEEDDGVGLLAIQPETYAGNVRGKVLRYAVDDHGEYAERELTMPAPLTAASLKNPEHSIAWGAALLAMWREQHDLVDTTFDQEAHRHHVSHFVWGDSVQCGRAEDRAFTDRRRLLIHYGTPMADAYRSFRGISWGSPLEASPRVVSSSPGASRDLGVRRHRGVDVESVFGEPVLAMADGRVFFSGVDLPGRGAVPLPAGKTRGFRRRMGKGGRFVCIDHVGKMDDEEYLRSCYMHLDEAYVVTGEEVHRGDIIGTVGRTGIKVSAPHLHLEVKSDKRLYDARDVVPGILIGEPPLDPPKRKQGRRPAPALWPRLAKVDRGASDDSTD
jgi:murein DD-endopeptidase MepM/ murein hydrolase activator NlpD